MKVAEEKLLDKLAEGYQIIDPKWRYVYLNDAALKQGRSTRTALIGRTIMDCYPGIEKTPLFKALHACLEKRKMVRMENLFTYPDGSQRWFDLHIEPVAQGILVLSIDITDQKMVDRAKTEFVALASHQLRTPTSIIRWGTEDLRLEEKSFSEGNRDTLRRIEKANMRSIKIIDTLLHISRLEAGTIVTNPELVHPHMFLANEIDQLDEHIRAKKLQVSLKCPAGTPDMTIDTDYLQIIIHNLLSNAVKYTPAGGKVVLTVTHDAHTIHFTVADTGCGIPKSQHSKIFGKMFRADNAKEIDIDGNGLGLYLARALARSIKGDITFTSTEGKGSTFYVDLPLVSTSRKGSLT